MYEHACMQKCPSQVFFLCLLRVIVPLFLLQFLHTYRPFTTCLHHVSSYQASSYIYIYIFLFHAIRSSLSLCSSPLSGHPSSSFLFNLASTPVPCFQNLCRSPKMPTSQLRQVRRQRFSLEDRDPLNCFNEHVKGPLLALVESQIGNELRVPFHIALIACLPMIFYSSVNVLACDNGPCETSAVLSGYSSVTQYMVTQIVAWTLTIFLSFPVTSPILLRMINFAVSRGNGPLELFMALLCCPLAYMWSYTCGGLIWGSIVAPVQILGALICFFWYGATWLLVTQSEQIQILILYLDEVRLSFF